MCTRIQAEIGHPVVKIRNDREKSGNIEVDLFCDSNGFKHEYLAPRSPQPNKVVEMKNLVLQEMAKVMLHIYDTPVHF